jgi:hypothetical protein
LEGLRNAYKIVARKPKRNRNLGYTAFTEIGGVGMGRQYANLSQGTRLKWLKKVQRRPVLNTT